MRTCPYCKDKYQPSSPVAPACCDKFECRTSFMSAHVAKQRKTRAKDERIQSKEDRKTLKLKLDAMKPLSYYADKAQTAVNAYRRAVLS